MSEMLELLTSFLGEWGDSILDCLSALFDGSCPKYSRAKIKERCPLPVKLFILLLAVIVFLLWI